MFFKDVNEAILAYENHIITLQAPIQRSEEQVLVDGEEVTRVVSSTLGRFIFNEGIPQDLGYVDRREP